jgi:phenylalanyl-tRNA synthetase beta chain
MKVSLNTLKELLNFELPETPELVARINEQLGGVEEVVDLGAKYKGAVIVRVVSAEKHPDADRLSVCRVDDSGSVQGLARDEQGYVQVVCGAPNVHADMFAIWLPPGMTVPSSFDTAEPFVLSQRDIRGVMSNGMLAAADELAIGSDHDGIVELTLEDLPLGVEDRYLSPGQDFAELFGLDDTIIDIENKMFTHRPDCFGQLGVAREISAILKGLRQPDEDVADTRFVNPDWYWLKPSFETGEGLELEVFNESPEKSSRFMAVAMQNIVVKPSPLWLQTTLVRWGSKPINNVVDVTNYVMLLTAQPTHAYDYDKLRGHKLGVRMAKSGEELTLLNGKSYKLDIDDIVIADGDGAVGLAGIMGGGNSEVSETTKSIVLEVANFDMYTLRKSSMRHGVFTDALTRFNKGQSPLQNDRIIAHLMQLMAAFASAEQASDVYDLPDKADQLDEVSLCSELPVGADFINTRLGTELTIEQVGDLLRRANFASYPREDDASTLLITAPFWRTDIELPEDIVEEVGRLYGFDKLPRELPVRLMTPAPKNHRRTVIQKVRESLSSAGANEVLTYSFVHENVMSRAEQDVSKAFRLSNALSPELQYYRLSMTPSLLDKVHMNIKAGHDEFMLFEVGKAHHKDEYDEESVPREFGRIAAVYANKRQEQGAPYYRAKRSLEVLAIDLNISQLRYQPLSDFEYGEHDAFRQMCAPFDPTRSAIVWNGEMLCGVVGEYKRSVATSYKLPNNSAGFELFVSMFEKAPKQSTYVPLSRYPSTSQDISLRGPAEVQFGAIDSVVAETIQGLDGKIFVSASPTAIYQADDSSEKTTTYHLVFTSSERTLTDEDVAPVVASIASRASDMLGLSRV